MKSRKSWKDNDRLSPDILLRLSRFIDLLIHWNSRINLTGYRRRDEIEDLLIGESVLAGNALMDRSIIIPGTRVLDFGSGAGIPGLVWSILALPIELTSLEIRHKKIAFQKEVVRELGLDTRVLLGKFPEAVSDEKFKLIVSRAIRFDSDVWKEGERCLHQDGCFVRFVSPDKDDAGWNSIPVSERTSLLVAQKKP